MAKTKKIFNEFLLESDWKPSLPKSERKTGNYISDFTDYIAGCNQSTSPSGPAIDYIVVLTDPKVAKYNLTYTQIGELLGTEDSSLIGFVRDGASSARGVSCHHQRYAPLSFTVWSLIAQIAIVYYLVFDAEDMSFISESVATVAEMVDVFSEPESIYSFVRFINAPLGRLQDRRADLLKQEGLDFEELLFTCLKTFQRYYLRRVCSLTKNPKGECFTYDTMLNDQFLEHFQAYEQQLKLALP